MNKLLYFSVCSGRHRWVIYTTEMNGKKTLWEVDGSMVPAEWYDLQCYRMNTLHAVTSQATSDLNSLNHSKKKVQLAVLFLFRHRWLHCMTDDPPTTHPPEPKKFLADIHQFNVSGSPQQYVPFSTTRKKIHEWVPPKAGAQ